MKHKNRTQRKEEMEDVRDQGNIWKVILKEINHLTVVIRGDISLVDKRGKEDRRYGLGKA